MRFTEGTVFAGIFVGVFVIIGASIASEVFMGGYNRFLYQKSYEKSIDCRISYKGSKSQYIDQACGPLPKFEDFVK
jgi:hypothetical protein